MASRDKDQATPHQPLLSSLIVRPTDSGGGGVASDYEPGEVRRDPPHYSRSDRYSDHGHGYRIRAGSGSPGRRRDVGHHYNSEFDQSARSGGFESGRDPSRYREPSPPYGRERGAGRPFAREFDGPGSGPAPFRGGAGGRNNPNVRPREGDWICPNPSCGYLNFARREYCNNCNSTRFGPGGSPRRGYPGPPPPDRNPRRFSGPPMDRSPPGRSMNGYRSPPHGWARNGPREFFAGGVPHPRHEGRFSDHSMRRDRLDYLEEDYRERNRFERPLPPVFGHRDRGRDSFFDERKGYERRPLSPLPPPPMAPPRGPMLPHHRGRWGNDMRDRSPSPLRGPPSKDYRRDMYLERGRDDRRGAMRDAY